MHTFDVTIYIPGQGSFHVSLNGYTHNDALRLAKVQYPGGTIMNIQQVS